MNDNSLDDRRRALEEAFFAKQNEALRQRLIEKDKAAAKREALSASSGITNPEVLDTLVGLNISSETLAAISLIPLVGVAWADGSIDSKERDAVLAAAAASGLAEQEPGHELLGRWLLAPPPPELLASWKGYVSAVSGEMTAEAKQAFRSELLTRARNVAEAAGGFLRLGRKISSAEEIVLKQLDDALA